MILGAGTDRLESVRLVLRRMTPDDLPFLTRLHALPEVARYLYPDGPHSPAQAAAWLRNTLTSYEQDALGRLAVLRKEDGAIIGRCGLSELIVETAVPERGPRRGWFGRESVPAGVAVTFERELGYTFDPAVWGRVSRPRPRVACATMRATFCACPLWFRWFIRKTPARGASPIGVAHGSPGRWRLAD